MSKAKEGGADPVGALGKTDSDNLKVEGGGKVEARFSVCRACRVKATSRALSLHTDITPPLPGIHAYTTYFCPSRAFSMVDVDIPRCSNARQTQSTRAVASKRKHEKLLAFDMITITFNNLYSYHKTIYSRNPLLL